MRLLSASAAALVAMTMLSGCSDQKAANKENFKAAVTAFFDKNCLMLPLSDGFPGASAALSFPYLITAGPGAEKIFPKLAALQRGKVIDLKTAPSSQPHGSADYLDYTYDLTDSGRPLYRAANALGPGSPSGLCAGHLRIVSLDRFTEPVDHLGRRVSQATFTGEPKFDDWTKEPAIQAAFAQQLRQIQPVSQTLPLVLMNDGWLVDTNMSLSN